MKIAVAAMGKTVAYHFGHCENFIFFDTADGGITGVNSVPNPGHRPGFLPNFLADNGAEVVIAGGMGGGAVDIFEERGEGDPGGPGRCPGGRGGISSRRTGLQRLRLPRA